MNARRGLVGVLLAGSLALSGCGSAATLTAAEQVPELRAALSEVDSALAGRHYFTARKMLGDLIAQTRRAEQDGSISAARAEEIISAARRLLRLIPKPSTTAATPTPTPTQRQEQQPTPDPSKTPKPKKKPKPEEKKVSATPTPTVEPTPTPTPEPTPTDEASPAAASPAAVTSPTP